ncbi:MAG: hypothetical protein Salg2KO_04130 [Salibacteraceae bacterium]
MKALAISFGFGLILAAVHYGLFQLVGFEFRPIIAGLYLYMFGFSALFHLVLIKVENPKHFVNYYMGFSGGKLMLSLFLLLIYGLLDPEYLRPFAFSFLLVYFTFTAFEIVRLLKHLKN